MEARHSPQQNRGHQVHSVNSEFGYSRGERKYLVVFADEKTKEITACDHSDFDDAGIRPLLEAHLDPVPDFEILRLRASNSPILRRPAFPPSSQSAIHSSSVNYVAIE
jgi:hypothetical protein